MKARTRAKTRPERGIDRIVVAQANNDAAWEAPIRVRKRAGASVPLSPELASRAAFFARLHRESSVANWLRRIVQERINMEEAAFAEVKRRSVKKIA